jgi:hypothetical protein
MQTTGALLLGWLKCSVACMLRVAYVSDRQGRLLYLAAVQPKYQHIRWRTLHDDGIDIVESWTVQLLTILGVAVGAMASFVATRLTDRARWQREEALRWDTKRLKCYGQFAVSIKHFVTVSQRLSADRGLPGATGQPLDSTTGLPMLAAAEEDLSVKWENVLMLGSPETITAAREWRHVAWHLEWLARGLRDDPSEYPQANIESGAARRRFYSAVRAELGIVGGPIPDLPWPPAWQETAQQPPDSPRT